LLYGSATKNPKTTSESLKVKIESLVAAVEIVEEDLK